MRRVRSGVRMWRRSLQVRVITTTMAIGLVALAVIGVYVSQRMQDDLFTARVDRVLDESARSTLVAQATFDASTANTSTDLQRQLGLVASRSRRAARGSARCSCCGPRCRRAVASRSPVRRPTSRSSAW